MNESKNLSRQDSQVPSNLKPVRGISQGHRGLSVKCLSSFRGKIIDSNWRSQQSTDSQPNSRTYSGGSKNQVRELNDTEFPHAFLVSGKQLELHARSQEEMNDWIKQLQSQELGKRAPQWVRDKLVTMCMRCKEPFSAITRRRHHCWACGYMRHLLPDECHGKHKGILEKESAEVSGQSLICSFLQLLDKNGKGSIGGWFVIPSEDPLVLYIYAAPQARTSVPLLGYQVEDMSQNDSRHIFQLDRSKQIYTLMAETEELKQRWMKALG